MDAVEGWGHCFFVFWVGFIVVWFCGLCGGEFRNFYGNFLIWGIFWDGFEYYIVEGGLVWKRV